MDRITYSLVRASKASFVLAISTLKKVLPTFIKRPIRHALQYTIRFLRTYIAPNHCPVALPWFQIRDPKKEINKIHRLAFDLESPRQFTPLEILAYSITWPTSAAIRAVFCTLKKGRNIKKVYNIGLWAQLRRAAYLAIFYNIPLDAFYFYRFFLNENYNKAGLYIQHHEICSLLPWINRDISADIIHNKLSFYVFCMERAIPTAPVIVAFSGTDGEEWFGINDHLPTSDLITKPTDLWCGRDIQKWTYKPRTGKYLSGKNELTQSELLEYCRKISVEEPLIIQPVLRNDPSIQDLSTGGLCTLRVVTYRLEGEKSAYLGATFRMPTGSQITDHFMAGGVAAALTNDGKLGRAFNLDPCVVSFSHHPSTNGLIEGRLLPSWQKMVDLALETHQHFTGPSAIGWDIALTESGPIVLEGNPTWGAEIMQIPQNRPLGESSFPRLFTALSETGLVGQQ